LGQKLRASLQAQPVAQLAEVRGPGSMIAAEFFSADKKQPDAEFTKRLQAEAMRRGLILLTCGVYSNVIRFLYPLTIPEAHFDEALEILSASLAASA
jgi:4-aminobutyrate aminotransferase-like enzyme